MVDSKQIDKILRENDSKIKQYSFRVESRDSDEREDVQQVLRIRTYKALKSYDPEKSSLNTYLHNVLKLEVASIIRNKRIKSMNSQDFKEAFKLKRDPRIKGLRFSAMEGDLIHKYNEDQFSPENCDMVEVLENKAKLKFCNDLFNGKLTPKVIEIYKREKKEFKSLNKKEQIKFKKIKYNLEEKEFHPFSTGVLEVIPLVLQGKDHKAIEKELKLKSLSTARSKVKFNVEPFIKAKIPELFESYSI